MGKKSVITGPKKIVPRFLRYVYCRAESTYILLHYIIHLGELFGAVEASWSNKFILKELS